MNKGTLIALIIIGVVVLAGIIFNPIYIVRQGEQAVITRFGKLQADNKDAGLHFKMPIADTVLIYSNKILPWDSQGIELTEADQRKIVVDVTARWKIKDPGKFYETTGRTNIQDSGSRSSRSSDPIRNSYAVAQKKLDEVVANAINSIIAKNRLFDMVRSDNYINDRYADLVAAAATDPEAAEILELLVVASEDVSIPEVEFGRDKLSEEMKEQALKSPILDTLGIELIDVFIVRIRYQDAVVPEVFNKMISQRRRIAGRILAEGEKEKNQIAGRLSEDKDRLLSEGQRIADERIATADAEAASIYSKAYSADPEFYSFWVALETYKKTLPKMQTTLSTDMDFFKYLYDPNAR